MTEQNPAAETARPSLWRAFSFARILIVIGVLAVAIAVVAALCSAPEIIAEVKPAAPTPIPTLAPTWTPVPTWTPIAPPTATPHPLADLPLQQRHYQEYRVFHMVHEYTLCYRAHIKPPPTPVPTPTAGPTPEYSGAHPTEPWRDDPRFLAPTPTLRPTEVPGGFPGHHRPPKYGLSDAEVEDHALADIGGATRWLIARYDAGECEELSQFTVFPGRLVWLNRYADR